MKWLDKPEEIYHAACGYLSHDALAAARTPAGHPEGYLEAFAVLYREFAEALTAWKAGNKNPLPATNSSLRRASEDGARLAVQLSGIRNRQFSFKEPES